MYQDRYSEEITKKLAKLRKKDPAHYFLLRKKIEQILASPNHNYKYLHYTLKGIKRVHMGHFVLIFVIDSVQKIVSFEDYDHHDKIYQK